MEAGRVTKVRVFVDRAAITRTRTIDQPVREISFAVLPLDADTATLRAHAQLGKTALKVTGVVWGIVYGERGSDRQRAIAKELEALRARLASLDDEESNETRAAQLLMHYAQVASATICREWLDREASFERWNIAFDHLRKRHSELASARAARQLERAAIQKKQADLLEEDLRLGRPEKLGYRVTVSLDLPENASGMLTVELTYVTPRAQWMPIYDLRHHAGGGDARERVKLTGIALVRQNTGEDWTDVELIATTARPPLSEPPPELAPLLIVGAQGRESNEIVSTVREAPRLAGVVAPEGEAGPASVEHRAPGKVSIPATHQPVRVELFSVEIPCRARLEVAPRERPVAMLVADFENRSGRLLLPGRVNVFRGPNYSGQAQLGFIAANERVRLPLGTDASVRVTRELKSHPEKKGTITGATTHAYESRTMLENLGNVPLELLLRDRVPVSRSEDAAVKITELDRSMEVQADTGLATMVVSIAPHAKREVMLAYKITAPRGFRLRPPPIV